MNCHRRNRRGVASKLIGLGAGASIFLSAAAVIIGMPATVFAQDGPGTAQRIKSSAKRQQYKDLRKQIPEHDPAAEVDLGDGLKFVILKEGHGNTLDPGEVAVVDFTGWLTDGKVFNTSRGPRPSRLFTTVPGRLIEGWNRGLLGMKVGELRKIMVPAALGYGEKGYRKVPANADTIFEVELIAAIATPEFDPEKATTTDSGLQWINTVEGEGVAFADNGFAQCHLTWWDEKGVCVATTHDRTEPVLIKSNAPGEWSNYVQGMKEGGERAIEVEVPVRKRRPDSTDGSAPEMLKEKRLLLIEAMDVIAPINPTPHNTIDEVVLDNGLIIIDLYKGDGEELPKYAFPKITFSGWLADGTLFDSTKIPGANETRLVTPDFEIAAWTEGVKGMRVGDRRKIIATPDLAYGKNGLASKGVPGDVTLTFEIEVVGYDMPLFIPVGDGNSLFDNEPDDGLLFGEIEDTGKK